MEVPQPPQFPPVCVQEWERSGAQRGGDASAWQIFPIFFSSLVFCFYDLPFELFLWLISST